MKKNSHYIDLIENKFGDFIVFSTRLTPHTILYIKNKKIIKKDFFTKPLHEEVNDMLGRLNKPLWNMALVDYSVIEDVVIDEGGFWQFTLKI